jgi:hypothetical protein
MRSESVSSYNDIFPVELRYKLFIDCEVTESGSKTIRKLRNMLLRNEFLPVALLR